MSDPEAYTWDLAGNARTGASQTILLTNGGDGVGTLAVPDCRGGSTTQSVSFVSGTGTGTWSGNCRSRKRRGT